MARQKKVDEGEDLSGGDIGAKSQRRRYLRKLYGYIAILAITCALIGLLEYAHHALPTTSRDHFNEADQRSNTTNGASVATSSGFYMPASAPVHNLRKRQTFITGTPGSSTPQGTPVGTTGLPPLDADPPGTPSSTATPTSTSSPSTTSSSQSQTPSTTSLSPSSSGTPVTPTITPSSSSSVFTGFVTTDFDTTTCFGLGCGTSTPIFVDPSSTSTITSACAFPSGPPPSCTCPSDSEVPNCHCTPDFQASMCTCEVVNIDGMYYRNCVCPPDSCTSCTCGQGDGAVKCDCPDPNPQEVGCNCSYGGPSSSPGSCPRRRTCNCPNITCNDGGTVTDPIDSISSTIFVSNTTSTFPPSSTPPSSSPPIITTNSTISTPPPSSTISTTPGDGEGGGGGGGGGSTPGGPTPSTNPPSSSPSTPISNTTPSPSPNSNTAIFNIFSPSTPGTTTTLPFISLTTTTNSNGISTITPVTAILTLTPLTSTIATPTTPIVSATPSNSPSSTVTVITSTDARGQTTALTTTLAAVSTTSSNGIIFIVASTQTTGANGLVTPTQTTILAVQANPTLSVVTAPGGSIVTIPAAILTGAPSAPFPTGTGSGGLTGVTGATGIGNLIPVIIYSIPEWRIFVGSYLPIMLAKAYSMVWTAIHLTDRQLAPFARLKSATGATTAQLFGAFDPVTVMTLVPAAVSWVVVPFAADLIYFDTDYGCPNPDVNNPFNPCWPPRMTANSWVIRLLQALLAVIALSAIALIATQHQKPHDAGIDPASIGGIAAIAGHPQVARDFAAVPAELTSTQLKKMLKSKVYTLGEYADAQGTMRYGLIPSPDNPPEGPPPARAGRLAAVLGALSLGSHWTHMSTYFDGTFGLYASGLLILTAVYLGNVDNGGLARMFNGASYGYRIFFAVLGSVIAFSLNRLQRDVQSLSPYMRLSHLNAEPQPTILLRKHTLPITSVFPMLHNRHWIAGATAFVALLSEFLIITFSGVPYRPGQLRFEFLFCAITSLVIIAFIIIILIVVNIWKHRLPTLPRKPDSVAAILTYVCQSEMLRDFEGLEQADISDRDAMIRQRGKKYGYGLKQRHDGVRAWTVDQMGGSHFEDVRGANNNGRSV